MPKHLHPQVLHVFNLPNHVHQPSWLLTPPRKGCLESLTFTVALPKNLLLFGNNHLKMESISENEAYKTWRLPFLSDSDWS